MSDSRGVRQLLLPRPPLVVPADGVELLQLDHLLLAMLVLGWVVGVGVSKGS